jgi:hypothetical protein
VVNHPEKWKESGFTDIQKPPKRYGIIDLQSLSELCGFADLRDFQRSRRQWAEKGWRTGWRSAMIAGPKPLRLAVWHLLGTSRIGWVSKPCIAM